jgi:hypothetical protein
LKYLKTYKLFESDDYSNLTEDIKDLVADLEDLDEIKVYITTTLEDKPIIIFQHKYNLIFDFKDIEYYVFRIVSYLGKEKVDKISYLQYDISQWIRTNNRKNLNLENDQDLDKIKSEKIVNLDIILK